MDRNAHLDLYLRPHPYGYADLHLYADSDCCAYGHTYPNAGPDVHIDTNAYVDT